MSSEYNYESELYPEEPQPAACSGLFTLADFSSTNIGRIASCPMGLRPVTASDKNDARGKACFDLQTGLTCPRADDCPVSIKAKRAELTCRDAQVRLAKRMNDARSEKFRNRY
jgi:hypothetical protein